MMVGDTYEMAVATTILRYDGSNKNQIGQGDYYEMVLEIGESTLKTQV